VSVGIARIRRDIEAELSAHGEHRGVFTQYLSFDSLEAFGAGIFDDHLHEQVAETVPFHFGADKDGVFAAVVVRVGGRRTTPSILPNASSIAMKAMARA